MLVLLLCFAACGQERSVEEEAIDSLNMLAYRTKYQSLGKAMGYADEVLTAYAHSPYHDGLHEALLNKGDVYGMRMDYDSARVCYQQVLAASNNGLLCGVADVDMMSVCLMTSMSKEFYDYRSDAYERLEALEELAEDMTEHQNMLWNAVRTEYHFVSLNYFMKMRQTEGVSEEFDWLEQHQDLFAADTMQLSTYLFLKSIYSFKNGKTQAAVDEMHRSLLRLLSLSRRTGNVYFEISALNRLARSVIMGSEMRPSRQVFVEELVGDDGDGDFGYKLANRALWLARQYGNDFVQTTVLVTLSDYYLQKGEDSLAVVQMEQALELINANHQKMCRRKGIASQERLYVSEEALGKSDQAHGVVSGQQALDSLSTEMRWITDADMMVVPEWIAMVREQLSIIFGAMGKKAESDYNHNLYFDILDVTRQDLRVLQEEENLKKEEQVLNLLLWVLAVAMVVLIGFLYFYNRRSKVAYRKSVETLSQVVETCKRLSSALSDQIEDVEELDAILHRVADADVERLFPQTKGQDWTKMNPQKMSGLERELFHVLLVFYEWMRQRGVQFVQFAEQQQLLDSETYVFEKRLEEDKRQYMEKLTSMSIVNGITPFLDRALHEVNKLKTDKHATAETVRERFLYLSELVDKINEYNDVLGHWVKIRQGMVTLNIENFPLQPLFETLKHGARAFDLKGVTLQVSDTSSVVKADKALTLFMMNTLLDNARKYTPERGCVELRAEETERYVEISVEDTGHGMSAEDVEMLNHSKVYDSTCIGTEGEHADAIRQNKGFGFGLMNCKGIIGKYKKTNAVFSVCEFGVESELGKGSRFFFRLPKGVLKTLVCAGVLWLLGQNPLMGETAMPDSLKNGLQPATMYADSVFSANVAGEHERAVQFADSAISCLNRHIQRQYPRNTYRMQLEGEGMAELEWWKRGYETDYELIISIRNEVAIAALALNRNALYHYNNEVFTRLYTLTSTDPALEAYCNHIKMANRNKKTTAILLGMLIFFVLTTYFFLYYRNHQLFILNLRQFILQTHQVFTSSDETLPQVLSQGLSDTKTDEESLLKDLATQFMNIHIYFSRNKVGEMNELLELKRDERQRKENEQQKVYVRNQIMDNSLSTLKHETMYYPNRIKQMVDAALNHADAPADEELVSGIDELLSYYKDIYTILSTCAGKQVEAMLFKRTRLSAQALGEMAARAFQKQKKRNGSRANLRVATATDLHVQGDRIFLQMLMDNIVSLFFEHHSGGDLRLDFEDSEGFATFAFTDTAYQYEESDLSRLFHVDNIRYDAKTDTLSGAQYLICRQIIREHDAHSSRRGCRVYVENCPEGNGSRFVFTLPLP